MKLRFHLIQLLGVALVLAAWLAGLLPAEGMPILAMALAPFPVTPKLQGITLAYRNRSLIGDEILPRVPVGLQAFKYLSYPKGTFFTLPETLVGRKGRPNTVEFEATEIDSSTKDYALDDEVPVADINNAAAQPGMPDPLARATEGITELLALAREVRVASLVFDAAQYAAANKVTLAGNDQWSSGHDDGNPIVDITVGLDVPIMRPNVAVMGQAVSTKLRQNKYIVKAFNGTTGDAGIVPMGFIKEIFELEDIYVGQGWVNIAKKGQVPNIVRVWGKHFALLHRNKNADTQRGTTFGYTAEWGTRVAGSERDSLIGMRGGERVRVGESVKELITANDLGYLIADAVA